MARIENNTAEQQGSDDDITLVATGNDSVSVPDSAFVTGSKIIRDGQDLKLENPDGLTVTIEGYFSVDPAPVISCPDGQALTPDLVASFAQHQQIYAQNSASMTDESPVGAVTEISGSATVTHVDGTTEIVTLGTPIYEGDVIETNSEGSLNIEFVDDTQFAVANDARLAVDEYVFDPATESGTSDFSVLRGLFVFTSGLIGRDDPDDVEIDTPMGSIGIRGTMIAGNVDTGEITVLEGAIVLRGVNGGEITLAEQFETAQFNPAEGSVDYLGTQTPESFAAEYSTIKAVSPYTFMAAEPDTAPIVEDTQTVEEAPEPVRTEDGRVEDGDTLQTKDGVPLQQDGSRDPKTDEVLPDDNTLTKETTETSLVFNQQNDAGFDEALNPEDNMTGTVRDDETKVRNSGGTITNSDPALTLSSAQDTDTQPPPPAHLEDLLHDFNITNISSQIGTLTASGADILIATFRAVVLNTDFNQYDFRFVFNNPDDTLFTINRVDEFTLEIYLNDGQTLTDDVYDIRVGASLNSNQFIGFNFGIFDPLSPNASDNIDLGALMAAGSNTDGRFTSGSGGERLGDAVAVSGDVNNDGRPDLIIADSVNGSGGAAAQYSGNGSLISLTPFGDIGINADIASAGDIDGDGQSDFVWGTMNSSQFSANSGLGDIVTSTANITITGPDAGDYFGSSVAGLGDINGDGLSDVLFGAIGEDNISTDEGSAFIIYGRDNGSLINVDTLGASGFEIEGGTVNANFGSDAASAGDLDNDGYADFAVAATGTGEVSIFFGDPSATSIQASEKVISGFAVDFGVATPSIPLAYLGDVDGDSIGDLFAASTDAGGEAYIFSGATLAAAGASISVTSASSTITGDNGYELVGGGSAGDFNGDGLADIALAFRNGDQAEIFVIDSEALAGSMTMSDLLNTSTATRLHFDLNDAGIVNPSTSDFTFEFTGGDLNGDGFDDLVIGTPQANNGDGGFFTIYGRPEDDDLAATDPDMHAAGINGPANVVASSSGDALVGNANANILNNVNGGSTFGNISFRAGDGNDQIRLNGDNARHIDGGAGADVLTLFGAGTNIDFAAMGSEYISNIESIEMSETGQSITLGIDDIFRLMQQSQADATLDANRKFLKISDISGGTTSLNIDDNGGSVPFTLGTSDQIYNDGTSTYDAYYINDGYALLIDQNIDAVTIV